jgi:RHS repeat-associated protein
VVKADHPSTTKDFGYLFDEMGNRKRSCTNGTDPITAGGSNLAVYSQTTASATPEGGNPLNQYSRLELYGTPAINPTYDADGNQLSGRFATTSKPQGNCVWDGENQLIQATQFTGQPTFYTYDAYHRRVAIRNVSGNTTYTVYDGWNPIAEYTRSTGSIITLQTAYTWGTDLSGSLQGAGGVGGLLAVQKYAGTTGTYLPTYDGNGNVSEYIHASYGSNVAHYEYGPFGEQTVATGSLSTAFRHRFSTKPLDEETGYYYYGFRSYDPLTGRWMGRDLLREVGGINMYGILGNDCVDLADILGLEDCNNTTQEKDPACMKKAKEKRDARSVKIDEKSDRIGANAGNMLWAMTMGAVFGAGHDAVAKPVASGTGYVVGGTLKAVTNGAFLGAAGTEAAFISGAAAGAKVLASKASVVGAAMGAYSGASVWESVTSNALDDIGDLMEASGQEYIKDIEACKCIPKMRGAAPTPPGPPIPPIHPPLPPPCIN